MLPIAKLRNENRSGGGDDGDLRQAFRSLRWSPARCFEVRGEQGDVAMRQKAQGQPAETANHNGRRTCTRAGAMAGRFSGTFAYRKFLVNNQTGYDLLLPRHACRRTVTKRIKRWTNTTGAAEIIQNSQTLGNEGIKCRRNAAIFDKSFGSCIFRAEKFANFVQLLRGTGMNRIMQRVRCQKFIYRFTEHTKVPMAGVRGEGIGEDKLEIV